MLGDRRRAVPPQWAGRGFGAGGQSAGRSRRPGLWALCGYLTVVAGGLGLIGGSLANAATGVVLGVAFLVAAGIVVITFQRFSERAYEQHERYRRELFDAELGALASLREAGQIREDVIASVSHEFRTPLTAIRGSASTLLARAERMRGEDREKLLAGIVEHSERLGRLLEDMLLAASATAAGENGSIADVSAAMSGFTLDSARPPVTVEIEAHLAAYVDSLSLSRVVRALADHVGSDARRDRPVTVRAHKQAGEVLLDVVYTSNRDEDELRRLFEPFGSRESARTGRPVSLALYLARRLTEAHGGRVTSARDREQTRIRVAFRGLRERPGALPAPGAESGPLLGGDSRWASV
jgi:signal transduction histidine kinase